MSQADRENRGGRAPSHLLGCPVADLLNEKCNLKRREHLITRSNQVPGREAPERPPGTSMHTALSSTRGKSGYHSRPAGEWRFSKGPGKVSCPAVIIGRFPGPSPSPAHKRFPQRAFLHRHTDSTGRLDVPQAGYNAIRVRALRVSQSPGRSGSHSHSPCSLLLPGPPTTCPCLSLPPWATSLTCSGPLRYSATSSLTGPGPEGGSWCALCLPGAGKCRNRPVSRAGGAQAWVWGSPHTSCSGTTPNGGTPGEPKGASSPPRGDH